MPAASSSSPPPLGTGITKLTNCRLVIGDSLIPSDLFINSLTGKIISPSDDTLIPDVTIDLHNRILSPGLIDCQLNGAFGFNFSSFTSSPEYIKNIHTLNTKLIRTGVTSYLPTLTSQTPELYHSALPHLGPLRPIPTPTYTSSSTSTATTNEEIDRTRNRIRHPQNGSESLGAHVEGPFLSPSQHGIHDLSVLRSANSWQDLEEVYGLSNLTSGENIKMITIAPELGSITTLIPELVQRGVVVSLGHTECTLSEAAAAVRRGAKMVTHLFNAMNGLHHREPGIFGLLGLPQEQKKGLYYGVIADGIHLHPCTVSLAYNLHPQGFILVTDAMHLSGMPDGKYEWVNGEKTEWIEKRGSALCIVGPPSSSSSSSSSSSKLSSQAGQQNGDVNNGEGGCHDGVEAAQNGQEKGKEKWGGIAGSSSTLLECVNNLLKWTGMSVPKALASVTSTPAEMLGFKCVKGSLEPGADADLVVFEEMEVEVEDLLGGSGSGKTMRKQLVVEEVWKFGVRVCRDGWE
ncbi:hypothetical protein B0H65DRAFT_218128 [Neurospora tetraspora]|uniref:Amidohydrolase-related domain-containing protein n=1 Tax=Neurospora tetraspora TaxID=94610 RepID=A0AAE0JC43_9PEZI|nr:hypothetical protein B0H65DRAFT_218128 [Neurospora tetraspora]